MAKWDIIYAGTVSFICICVENLSTALQFGQNHTGTCINAFIRPEDMPSFPVQLGCSGFVVLDSHGGIVTTRSSPRFLDAEQRAFRSVERLLAEKAGVEHLYTPTVLHEPVATKPTEIEPSSFVLPRVGHEDMDGEHAAISKSLKLLLLIS